MNITRRKLFTILAGTAVGKYLWPVAKEQTFTMVETARADYWPVLEIEQDGVWVPFTEIKDIQFVYPPINRPMRVDFAKLEPFTISDD